jgi:ferrous iron transport protein A
LESFVHSQCRDENDNRFHLENCEYRSRINVIQQVEIKAQTKLSNATIAEWYRIDRLDGPDTECQRLLDLGFTPGEPVAVVRSTPLGDPLVVVVRGTQLALRKREAAWIVVE